MMRKIWAGIILGVVVLSLVMAAVFGGRGGGGVNYYGTARGAGIGLVHIEGVITGGRSGNLFQAVASVEEILNQLRRAEEDPDIKAVVLRLNSPGGTSAASQEIGAAVARLRKSGKPVVASMSDVAASGAYWIASQANVIVANPASVTGSIGVIIPTQNYAGLYDKIGIETENIKSGPFKDMGTPSRPLTPEERAIFQNMVDDMYDQFVSVVAKGRHMDEDRVRELADGRVYSGRQARDLGLVDELGGLREAVRLAADMADIKGEPRIIPLEERTYWQGIFSGFSSSFNPGSAPGAWLIMDPAYIPGSRSNW
ncbi:MAG: signal peptide peptidase SppA [Peptococcaceae bacterium]|nr:signal peptide peptidase SppA [Peptococcaceae bacterium]